MWAIIEGDRVAEITDINPDGRFHESLVWVECAASVVEGDTYSDGVFSKPPPPVIQPEQIQAQKVALVQAHMDAAARALNYDSIANAITYADEPAVPKFQAEGQAFRAWRSLVWERCYEILLEVQDGTRPIPSDEELIAELPDLNLPGA